MSIQLDEFPKLSAKSLQQLFYNQLLFKKESDDTFYRTPTLALL